MSGFSIGTDNRLLISMARNDKRKPWELIRELIDNSIDAKATTIELSMHQSNFSIKDNGHGITKDRMIESWSRVGRFLDHESGSIGKYNVGMKFCLIALCDTCTIVTKTALECYEISFDWDNINDEFHFIQSEFSGSTGTLIRVDEPRISSQHIKKTLDQIGKTYRHLIGRYQILLKFNGHSVQPTPAIPWINKREIIGDGYRLEYGLFDTSNQDYLKSELDGVTVWYKDRMVSCGIKYDSIIGIPGNYSIQLFIEDGTKYNVSALKDEVAEAEAIIDFHAADIRDYIIPEHYKELRIEVNSLLDEIAKDLTDQPNVRGTRKPDGDDEGSVTPQQTERQRRRANSEKQGEKYVNKNFNKPRQEHLKIDFKATDDDALGYVERGNKMTVVWLDDSKPEVKKLFEPKENKQAIYLLVTGLLEVSRLNGQAFLESEYSKGVYRRIKGKY